MFVSTTSTSTLSSPPSSYCSSHRRLPDGPCTACRLPTVLARRPCRSASLVSSLFFFPAMHHASSQKMAMSISHVLRRVLVSHACAMLLCHRTRMRGIPSLRPSLQPVCISSAVLDTWYWFLLFLAIPGGRIPFQN
jgi:hypothetical protein